MDIEANILFTVHEGAPFCRSMMLALITYSKGAPFYNALFAGTRFAYPLIDIRAPVFGPSVRMGNTTELRVFSWDLCSGFTRFLPYFLHYLKPFASSLSSLRVVMTSARTWRASGVFMRPRARLLSFRVSTPLSHISTKASAEACICSGDSVCLVMPERTVRP